MAPDAPVAEVEVEVECDDAAVLDVMAMPGAGSGSKTAAGANSRAWVASHAELLESSVLWPFTRRGNANMLALVALSLVLLVVGAEVCDNVESCMANPWAAWGTYKSTSYCEQARPDHFMSEHANSVSNIAFVAVGFVMWACGAADTVRERSAVPVMSRNAAESRRRNHLTTFPVFSFLFGLSAVMLGFCSFVFHAHSSRFTQQLDVGGIYWVLAAPLFYTPLLFVNVNMARVRLVVLRAALIVLTLTTDVLMTWFKWSISASNAMKWMISFIVVLACLCMLVRKVPRLALLCVPHGQDRRRWTWRRFILLGSGALATLGLAYLSRELDVTGKWCNPTSFLQGHAVWHVLVAAPLLMAYLMLRSEVIFYEDEPAEDKGKLPA
jgi:hypothetical protein